MCNIGIKSVFVGLGDKRAEEAGVVVVVAVVVLLPIPFFPIS